jgi:hypothetical protein
VWLGTSRVAKRLPNSTASASASDGGDVVMRFSSGRGRRTG